MHAIVILMLMIMVKCMAIVVGWNFVLAPAVTVVEPFTVGQALLACLVIGLLSVKVEVNKD